MKLPKRKQLGIVLCLSLLAASYSLFWVSDTEPGTVKDSAAAASLGTERTPDQRQLAQQAQAAVRNTPQSSVRPARLDLDELPDLASQIRLAEASMAGSFADSVDRKRVRQRELVDRVAEQYQLDSNQITIQANNEGELRLLNFRQAIKTGDASGAALRLLSENPELFNLSSPETLTILRQSPTGSDGLGSILYGREFKGVKVNGNDVRVLVNPDGIKSVLGQFEYIDPTFDVSGSIPVAELERIVSSIDGYERFTPDVTTAERQIIFSGGLPSFVTSIKARDPWNRQIEAFIDPREKKVVKVEEYFYDVQVQTSAGDLAGNTVDFYVEDTGSISHLINKTIAGADDWETAINKFDRSDDESWYWSIVSSEENQGPWQKSAVSAMGGLLRTFEYFSQTHSLSGTGAPSKQVSVITDFRDGSEDNAFWFSDTIGLGAGESWNNVAGSLDVMAHEIVHGVIEYSSGLRYENQSGALNESFADIFGAMVDRDDWTVGEDLNGQGIRSLRDPTGFGDPAHMDDFRKWPLSRDKGGVHTNSGIPNRAFYLLAEGLTLEGLGSSIGKDKAEKLAYSTMVNLTRDSDFQAAAALMLTSAEARYGEESPESLAVVAAWLNVGIFLDSSQEEDDSPVGQRKPQYPLTAGDDLLISLYPRDGYIYDIRDDTLDLYAVKACISTQCYGIPYDSTVRAQLDTYVVDSTRTGPLNDVPVARGRPSAARTEEGYTWIAYVGTDGNAYFSPVVNFDFEPLKFQMPYPIARVGLSRDFKRFAFVLENSKDIYVYSFDLAEWIIYTAEGRSYSTNGAGEDVRRVDAVSFSVDSDQIVFDYEFCRPSTDPDLDCDFTWSIGILDLHKGFDYPFPAQAKDYDIGWPSLSSIGGERIVYQFWDYSSGGLTKPGIAQFDYFDRSQETIRRYVGLDERQLAKFGLPSYYPQDKGIVFSVYDPSFSRLDSSYKDDHPYISALDFENRSSFGGIVHRATYLNVYAEASVSSPAIDFGNVIKGNTATQTVSLENTGNQELEVTSVQASSGLEASLLNVRLAASGTETFSVKFDSNVVRRGKFTGSVDIGSTSDLGAEQIRVTAFVDIDSDGDGIGNAIDPDDDNDGVADYRDAYPLIALGGLSDLDSDGRPDDCDRQCQSLGMTADLDDDGDSMPDALELASGLNPQDPDDCPSWYCLRLNPSVMVAISPSFDLDGDGLSRAQELALGTNVRLPDTDGDGLNDGTEVNALGSNPLLVDTDGDGLDDRTEVALSTDPSSSDTDGDSMPDGTEVLEGLNPNDAFDCPLWFCPVVPVAIVAVTSSSFDYDGDELTRAEEAALGTDWRVADSDSDGVADGSDAFPLDSTETLDTDSDGTGNNADTDDDSDGVADGSDAFPLDSTETLDTDSDGTGNNADTDDDGDGVADGSDDYPLNPNVHQAPTTASQSLYLNLLPQTTNGGTVALTSTSQDGRQVVYSIVSNGSLGTATITDSSTGAFSYSTTSTVSGNDTFTYKVNDGYVDSAASTISLELRTDPLYKYQWHLDNTGQKNFASYGGTTGADLNVDTVITGGNTGSDVVVAIVDDGIEIAHEDLSGNVVSGGSWNYADSSTDPTPLNSTNNHGTAVAGIVASVGWNQIGGRGVAPNAKLKGFNILADPDGDGVNLYSTAKEANALGGGASSLFSDISVYNMSYGGPATSLTPPSTSTIQDQLAEGVSSGRGAKGAIYVASAGNDFYKGAQSSGDFSYCGDGGNRGSMKVACYDAVFDYKKGLPFVITVGALNADGVKSLSSTPGGVTWISAPGGEYGLNSNYVSGYQPGGVGSVIPLPGEPAIMTTDLSGCSSGTSRTGAVDYNSFNDGDFPVSENSNCNYWSSMNGTSSAAPMVSGVVALMLEANSNLGWRDVKHILASTASQVDNSFSADAISTVDYVQWITNSAGYKFHPWYGFGAVDAGAAVNAAATHTNLSSSAFTSWNYADIESTAISDGSLFSRTISESTAGTVEWVRVALLIDHTSPNHLGFRLESPSGTVFTLLPPLTALSTSLSSATWVFLPSNAFYGESMQGDWKIHIVDHIGGITGTYIRWSLQFLYR